MGEQWVTIREAAAAGTLRRNDDGVREVVGRWDQLLGFTSLRLARQLGADVQPYLTRRERADHTVRADNLVAKLTNEGRLEGGLRIPDAVGPILVRADLRQKRIQTAVDVTAPSTGRPRTRVNWLVRQLSESPDALRVDAYAARSRTSTSELLGDIRRDPDVLIDPNRPDIQRFRIVASAPMGQKRGTGRGGFIPSVLDLVDAFYEQTVQNLKPWTPSAPKLQRPKPAAEEAEHPDPALEPARPIPLPPPPPASTFHYRHHDSDDESDGAD
jgi:hypothetical protein